MQTNVLSTKKRSTELSKGELKKERRNGRIPAVVFGHEMGSIPLFVDDTEFKRMFADQGKIFELELSGRKTLVNAKNVQYDPHRKNIWHIDFHALKKGEETTVNIPLLLKGAPEGTKQGGTLQQVVSHIEVKGMPTKMPEGIELDVTSLAIGENALVRDIKTPRSIEVVSDLEMTVATVVAPQKAKADPEAEEEEGLQA